MIYIGEQKKQEIIAAFLQKNAVDKIFIIGSNLDFELNNAEFIKFSDVIMYKFFYRLLQEISRNTLVILNECLQKTNRHDLAYNCIRRYVLQTSHRIIFNYYPIKQAEEDFMILWDMAQPNPFLKDSYRYISKFNDVQCGKIELDLNINHIDVDEKFVNEYAKEKIKIIDSVNKDPDVIPRRLLKFVEKYKNKKQGGLDSLSQIKKEMNVGVTSLPVDQYYLSQIYNFKKGVQNVVEKIQCK